MKTLITWRSFTPSISPCSGDMIRSADAAARVRAATRVETASFVVVGAAVAGVPWLRTPITPARTKLIEILLGLGVGLWVIALLVGRRWPRGPFGVVVGVALALAWGWFLAMNARTVYDPLTLRLVERQQLLTGWPGSVDRNASVSVLRTFTLLALGAATLIDLSRRVAFRRMLVWGLAVNGAVLGLLGTLDRFGVGSVAFPQQALEGSHFGPFAYHANAAAYLNLCLPAGIVLWITSFGWKRRAAVGSVAATTLGCVFHVSKAGLVLTVVLLGVLRVRLWRRTGAGVRARVGTLAIALLAATAFLANVARWRVAAEEPNSVSARFAVWRIAASIWRDTAGGVGPGGFKIVFPTEVGLRNPGVYRQWIVTPWRPRSPTGLWMNVHNDPLQFLVEWGLPGAVLAGFALFFAVRALRSPTGRSTPVLLASRVALGIVGLHALIDFPLQVLAIQLGVITWLAIGTAESNQDMPSPPNLDPLRRSMTLRRPHVEEARR